jgi:DNA-binding transcriptional MocR family regulator
MAAELISFARGAPSADILPVDAVRDAAQRALADDWKRALSYGTGIGHPGLCEWIAERHGLSDPGQVMVTNGSLEAGAMLFQHLVGPSDRVVVEQPSYDRTLLLLERLGAERVGVPLEADGIDIEELERAVTVGPPV